MYSCKFCQIEIVKGTIDSNTCSEGGLWRNCCNCYKEKIGWANYDKYACRQCKTRAAHNAVAKAVAKALAEKPAEKEATDQAPAAEFDAAAAKAPAAKPAAEKASAAKKKRRREEAEQPHRAGGG